MSDGIGRRRKRARWLIACLTAWLVAGLGLLPAVASAQPAPASAVAAHGADREAPVLRVAVVGGLVLCGVWPALAPMAEAATGLRLELVSAAPKEGVVPAFAQGQADVLLIHGSDETYALQAQGLAAPLRAWAYNQHVIVGPAADPAGVAQARTGVEAVRRIKAADAPMIGFRDPGAFTIMQHLWRGAGLRPGARQQALDEAEQPHAVLQSAAARGAYVVVGQIPVEFGRMPAGDLRVLLAGDAEMRRVYVAVEPGPNHPADAARRERARRLVAYLLSARGQDDLRAANRAAATPEHTGPWIFPVLPADASAAPFSSSVSSTSSTP